MKDQIQVPFDSRDTTGKDKESGPKALSRPAIADHLKKPAFDMKWAKANLYRHCSCGRKTCRSPVKVDPANPWIWVYRDKITDDIFEHESLPKQGGEPGDFIGGEAWDWR